MGSWARVFLSRETAALRVVASTSLPPAGGCRRRRRRTRRTSSSGIVPPPRAVTEMEKQTTRILLNKGKGSTANICAKKAGGGYDLLEGDTIACKGKCCGFGCKSCPKE